MTEGCLLPWPRANLSASASLDLWGRKGPGRSPVGFGGMSGCSAGGEAAAEGGGERAGPSLQPSWGCRHQGAAAAG